MPPIGIDYHAAALKLRAVFGGRKSRRLTIPGFRTAAVLVPILNRPAGPSVLLTRRSESLREHRGQVAFPGGRKDEGEEPRDTALREAAEEICLEASRVEIVGELDDRPAISGYVVTPVIGLVETPPESFRCCDREVLEAFEAPLAALLEPSNVTESWRDASQMPPGAPFDTLLGLGPEFPEFDAVTRRAKVYHFDAGLGAERVIWGLSAYILRDLFELAFAD